MGYNPYLCSDIMDNATPCFTPFPDATLLRPLPDRFTFPFHYDPHPLCLRAAEALQNRLLTEDFGHDFGSPDAVSGDPLGKMFGVLVVESPDGTLGYLTAFSGKLGGSNHHLGFVPPVFDLLDEQGFYRPEEDELSALNREIERLENAPELSALRRQLTDETEAYEQALAQTKAELKHARQVRQAARDMASPEEFDAVDAAMTQESKRDHFLLKDFKKQGQFRLGALQDRLKLLEDAIQNLKTHRKNRSAELQARIFESYSFLNSHNEPKSLGDIFQKHGAGIPPAGAGECAAPKLLQYAYTHYLRPVAMAEFWWGASPIGEVRKHGHFYPACRGKCEPILGHMLHGLPMDPDPLRAVQAADLRPEILFDDDVVLVLNKPAGLLSVPGKTEKDSVALRIRRLYPEASGPLIVHRLDMATSGLMLIAKTEAAYRHLQQQFIKRTIQKRYEALLEGKLAADSGVIDLPLRVDLADRPRQMVCYTHGKSARTIWQVCAREQNHTRVHFFPVTGRTHQLRVHAAHPNGLNAPIVGDELYGRAGGRLCLHAAFISFQHPTSGQCMTFELPAPF